MRPFIALLVVLLAFHAAWATPTASSEYATGKVSRSEMLSAKRGTVIDAATGVGIADATVIASWHVSATGWERDSEGCVVRHIVQTDANGNFSLPDVSAESWFHPPHASTSERIHALAGYTSFAWYLTVFKPGYLRQGDAETLSRYTFMNRTYPDWEYKSPRTYATRDGYRIGPIKLVKDNLSPQEEILYLDKVKDFASCTPNPPVPASPEYDALMTRIRGVVRPIPCALPEKAPMPAWAALAFYGLDGGGNPLTEVFFKSGQGTADGFYTRMSTAAAGGPMSLNWHDATAGDLCWAQGQREKRP